ncbi:MAG TPA: GNAT family N-acetyltransferase [Ferroplasma sp.]|jgi:ribosomal protein S18 acetylase RimI-like enzyme|nr:GNAT family N-acetyltransferase [Ferroplasma sp.]
MQVRPYRRQDFHDIAIIEKMAFGTGAYSSFMLRKILNSSRGFTLVLDRGSSLHGYATMEPVDVNVIDIESIGILPEDQGKGYGSLLISAMENEAKRRSYSMVVLEVRERNEQAIKFYKYHGYEIFEFIEGYYNISFKDSKNAYRMRKII